MTDLDRTRALQAAALCLAYPDATLLEQRELLRQTAAALPPALGAELARFLLQLDSRSPRDLGVDYVDTFDLRRRCSLYLTYYAHGDTRRRGMALLRFSHAYRRGGLQLASEELPDHLAVVCEAAAACPEIGLELLREHRAGLELLRLALAEARSPYLAVVDLIRGVLPEAAPRDLERALQLAQAGPPAEEVGLEPFAPPEQLGARR